MRWVAAFAALASCTEAPPSRTSFDGVDPALYRGVETEFLDDDLVRLFVTMDGPRNDAALAAYADCAAAHYSLIRGFGFARHVRTTVYEEAGLWRGDAVYTISRTLPAGLRTIDAEVVLEQCAETGIPAV